MELNFATTEGTGLNKLIPHASEEVKDLIAKLLITESQQAKPLNMPGSEI